MKNSVENIKDYLVQLAGYSVSGEQNEAFGSYLHTVQALYRHLVELTAPYEDGRLHALGRDGVSSLRDSYERVFEATQEYRSAVKESGSENPNAQARDGLMERFSGLLMKDYNALSGTMNAEEKSLPEILLEARGCRVDLSGQNLHAAGAALSSRIPVTFQDSTGKQLSGYFTARCDLNKKKEQEELYRKAVEGHPEYVRAVDILVHSQTFQINCEQNYDQVRKNINGALKQENLRHSFDFLWQNILDNREELPVGRNELTDLLEALNQDDTFARRMAEFYRGSVQLKNKYKTLVYGAGIEDGSNIELRNAAMSTVAELFGVPDVLARSVRMKVLTDGKETEGVFMEEVRGSDLSRDSREGGVMTRLTEEGLNQPQVFRQLADLQALDFICGNIDRHSGNLIYQFEDGPQGPRLQSVRGIDNDCSFGNLPLTANDGVIQLVSCKMMMAISEPMALKILSVTPEMLRTVLKDFPFSEPELSTACGRLKLLKDQIVADSAYFSEHPDARPEPGRIRVVKDGEWPQYSLQELGNVGGKGNYFEKLSKLPDQVQSTINEKRKVSADQEEIARVHPELVAGETDYVPVAGVRLNELDDASVRFVKSRMEHLEREMLAVNSGFFISSKEFNQMKKAFFEVQTQMRDAGPGLSDEQQTALRDSFGKLLQTTDRYLEKKEAEEKLLISKGKAPSEVMKSRMAFAGELRKFTDERICGLEAERLKAQAPKAGSERISFSDLEEKREPRTDMRRNRRSAQNTKTEPKKAPEPKEKNVRRPG